MQPLSHREWLKLHEVSVELHAANTTRGLARTIFAGLQRLFPFDAGSVQYDQGGVREIPWYHGDTPVWQRASQRPGQVREPLCGFRMMAAWGPDFLPFRDAFFAVSAERHPHTEYYKRSGDGSARRLSDIMPMRKLRRTNFYNQISRPHGLRWQLTIYIPSAPANTVIIATGRGGRPDFSERDRTMLELLRPHVASAWARALRAEQAASTAVAACAGVTPREREVLQWISEGKTNSEIAIILNVSPLTVKTHVERLLGKLHCENRTALARVMIESRE